MYLLFDIGGTKMRLAISRDGRTFDEPSIVNTPRDFEEGMALFEKITLKLSNKEKINAVAGGIAGPLDREKTKLINSPNISGWFNKPLKKTIQRLVNAPVFIENDAAIIGLGEAVVGAGKRTGIVVYITISTGVGGVRIVDGKIDRNSFGFEPGHQIIVIDGNPCSCSGNGHLESYVSGSVIEKNMGKKGEIIKDSAFWDEVTKYLAIGLNNTIVHWSPDIVVLGGSVMESISIDRVRFYLKKVLKIFPQSPPVEKAKLRDLGGLYGALIFLQQSYGQSSTNQRMNKKSCCA